MNKMMDDFKLLAEDINALLKSNEYKDSLSSIVLQANIIFTDIKKRNNILIYLSKNRIIIKSGFSTSAGLSFIGSSLTWKRILRCEFSLLAAYVEGSIKVPNLRVNWSRLWKLSHVISNSRNLKNP